MGGSGGGGFFSDYRNPSDIARKIRDEEESTDNQAYQAFNAKVAEKIGAVLIDANNRDTDTINQHLKTIESALEADIEGTLDLRYGGSVSKHTYVDGLSDIDSLAIINNSELINKTPAEVKQYFHTRLSERLPGTDIKMGVLAITIKFTTGVEVQVLPAIKYEEGLKIPSMHHEGQWSNLIRPDTFALALKSTNIRNSGKLVPVIKLAKSIMSTLPENRRLSGYHTEALAVQIFSSYTGEKNHKEMLKHFFSEGSKQVLEPIRDSTGQSYHVDSYLNDANSIERKMVSDSMKTTFRKMKNADGSRDERSWDDIIS